MKFNTSFNIIFLAVLFLTTGCASIVSNSKWPVTVKSDPSGADVLVSDSSGKEIHHGLTPTTVTLRSKGGYFSSASYTIVVKKEGYKDKREVVEASFNGWYCGNILFGGLIGLLIVDPVTGAMYRFPDEHVVVLSKNEESDSSVASSKTSEITTVSAIQSKNTNHPTLATIKVTNYKYDNESRKGVLSVDVSEYGLDARDWVLKNIGKICSSKDQLLEAGKEANTGGKYRVLNESMKDGILTVEFTAGYD